MTEGKVRVTTGDWPRIRVVIPYFGCWPFWFEVFLASCAANPDVDWLLVGDCGAPDNLPANVVYEAVSFEEYKDRVSQRLGLDFRPENAYKLCDIKPMLGLIHQEQLEGYDFWAFGDIDLVYGNLRHVYTGELLARYHLLSSHATRVSGHLCLMRNTELMRTAFMRVPGWQQEITDPAHRATDERSFSRIFVKHKNFPHWLRKLTNQCYPMVRDSSFVERYTTPGGYIPWVDGTHDYPQNWFWQDGRIWSDRGEFPQLPYLHFYTFKKNFQPGREQIRHVAGQCYRINSEGISVVETTQGPGEQI